MIPPLSSSLSSSSSSSLSWCDDDDDDNNDPDDPTTSRSLEVRYGYRITNTGTNFQRVYSFYVRKRLRVINRRERDDGSVINVNINIDFDDNSVNAVDFDDFDDVDDEGGATTNSRGVFHVPFTRHHRLPLPTPPHHQRRRSRQH